jgi:tetratricopeptide (TPR) repeat protein
VALLFRYGQVLTLFKRHRRALEVFRAVTRADPSHRQAWSCAGVLLAKREEYQPAIDAFERAVALAPNDAAPHFNVAFLLQRIGRDEEAIARFERAIELDAKLERARRGLELSLARLERQAK